MKSSIDPVATPRPAPSEFSQFYGVAIGVSQYQDTALNLNYAADDAAALRDVYATLAKQFPDPHGQVRLCQNVEATEAGIWEQVRFIQANVDHNDLAIISFSGHGICVDDEFYFLPADYRGSAAAQGIPWTMLGKELGKVEGTVILVMDSCHSGEIAKVYRSLELLEDAVERVGAGLEKSNGLIVIAGSLGGRKAQEDDRWRHGALSLAMLEALQGHYLYQEQHASPLPSAIECDGGETVVSLEEIVRYAKARVSEVTRSEQRAVHNVFGRELALDDIVLPRSE